VKTFDPGVENCRDIVQAFGAAETAEPPGASPSLAAGHHLKGCERRVWFLEPDPRLDLAPARVPRSCGLLETARVALEEPKANEHSVLEWASKDRARQWQAWVWRLTGGRRAICAGGMALRLAFHLLLPVRLLPTPNYASTKARLTWVQSGIRCIALGR
jgi:hypothetical protein